VLYDGAEFGASAAEQDFLGLPGLLEPEQVAQLLRKRQADQLSGPARAAIPGEALASPATSEALTASRKELNGLIGAWHHRTGQSHAAIHADLRRACGGPALPAATGEQIRARIQMLHRWASSGR